MFPPLHSMRTHLSQHTEHLRKTHHRQIRLLRKELPARPSIPQRLPQRRLHRRVIRPVHRVISNPRTAAGPSTLRDAVKPYAERPPWVPPCPLAPSLQVVRVLGLGPNVLEREALHEAQPAFCGGGSGVLVGEVAYLVQHAEERGVQGVLGEETAGAVLGDDNEGEDVFAVEDWQCLVADQAVDAGQGWWDEACLGGEAGKVVEVAACVETEVV